MSWDWKLQNNAVHTIVGVNRGDHVAKLRGAHLSIERVHLGENADFLG